MMLAGLTDGRNTWLGALRTGPDPFDNGSWIWYNKVQGVTKNGVKIFI